MIYRRAGQTDPCLTLFSMDASGDKEMHVDSSEISRFIFTCISTVSGWINRTGVSLNSVTCVWSFTTLLIIPWVQILHPLKIFQWVYSHPTAPKCRASWTRRLFLWFHKHVMVVFTTVSACFLLLGSHEVQPAVCFFTRVPWDDVVFVRRKGDRTVKWRLCQCR